jgi:hypothetical protein
MTRPQSKTSRNFPKGFQNPATVLIEPLSSSSLALFRQYQSGIAPHTPNEQSINRHHNGMPRNAPNPRANGITSPQAISPKSNSQRLRTGSRYAPMKAIAITKCPNASQSVP